jgi:hypothetical protein
MRLREALSVLLTFLVLMQLAPPAGGAESIAAQISAMPPGTRVELRLKNKQRIRGLTGPVSATTFLLVVARTGQHPVAFDDVESVRRLSVKSHVTRNVLIVAGVAVVAVGITAAVLLRCGPLGCGHLGHF